MYRIFLLTGFILLGQLAAQGITFPSSSGQIQPGSDWTILQAAELDATDRLTDPTGTASAALIKNLVSELQSTERTGDHVVFHQTGANDDSLRLINSYLAPVTASSSELLSKASVDQLSDALASALSTPEVAVTCTGVETSQLWSVPSLLLYFQHDNADSPWRMKIYVVPEKNQLRYFECQYFSDDPTAAQNIEEVLHTFEGAAEPTNPTGNMVIAGIAGAVAGVLTALFRRRRQSQKMSAAGR